MKAIVVKDNEFKTIGIEVTASAKTLFSWGISPSSPFYWTKEINIKDWMTEIFEIVRLNAVINERNNFVRNFFEVAMDQKIVEQGEAVNFKKYDEETKRLEEKKLNIIKNII